MACSDSHTGLPTDATLDNRLYANTYFGFSFPIPGGWTIAQKEVTDSLQTKAAKGGRSLAAANTLELRAEADQLAQKFRVLLMVSGHPAGSGNNANIVFFAAASALGSRRLSNQDVIAAVDKRLTSAVPAATRLAEIETVNLGGRQMLHAAYSKPAHGITTRQDCYTMVHGDYALLIILSGITDEDMKELDGMLAGLRFAK